MGSAGRFSPTPVTPCTFISLEMDCCRASDTLPCEETDDRLGDDGLTRLEVVVAAVAVVDVATFSSDAVDRFAVDFSNLLNCFCILNDTFAGNLEVDASDDEKEALGTPLASIVVPLLLLHGIWWSVRSVSGEESNVGGGGVCGRLCLRSMSLLDTSIIGGHEGAGGGPGSSI